MKEKLLILFFLLALSFHYPEEQKIIDRIVLVYNLKEVVQQKTWKTFNAKGYDLPLVYFTNTRSYVANPTPKFLYTFKSDLIFKNQQIKIYRTRKRVDRLPFHMETGMTLGSQSDQYNYHSPFMMCSSYEVVLKKIPGVSSTDEWITMIMHEYFHGYQYKHKPYIDYYEKEIVQVPPDSLTKIYKNNIWFKKSVDAENQLLLNILEEKDSLKTKLLIADYFLSRNSRRKLALDKLKIDISKYEKCYETMEGTARYIEYSLYKSLATLRNHDIHNNQWLYLTEKSIYFYAAGFNLARVLDKLKVDYKSRVFKQGKISLEDLLLEYYQAGPSN